jgi:tetratricopeptide (TPR) repeat protein
VLVHDLNATIGRALIVGGDRVDALRRALAATDVPLAVAARGAAVLAMLGDPALARRGLPQWERGGVPAPTVAAARAYVRAAAGDVDRALEDLRASIPADPRQAASYLDVAVIQERAGRVDDAIATYRKILEASPAMGLNMAIPIARVNLGRLLQARGDTAGAREQFDILSRQWANAHPDFAPARELRALMAK